MKKLKLSRETLIALTPQATSSIHGGAGSEISVEVTEICATGLCESRLCPTQSPACMHPLTAPGQGCPYTVAQKPPIIPMSHLHQTCLG